jgi:hypothetical protein
LKMLCTDRRILFFLLILAGCLYGEGSYSGGTGLLRIPDGRIIEDGNLRLSLSHCYPYRNYAVTFGFLPFLELNGRIVEVLERKLKGSWEDYGYYKDKVADFKVLLFSEKEYIPSLCFGVQDFHGTQLFFNEYVAASKKVGNLDITIGYGGNFFGSLFREDNTRLRELKGIFGGMKWQINQNLSFLVEYDPTERTVFREEKINSNMNLGISWTPVEYLNLGYSFQRGREHGVFLSLSYPFGMPFTRHKEKEPFYGPVNRTSLTNLSVKETAERISKIKEYLASEGFTNIEVYLTDNEKELIVELENIQYVSNVKALGRGLRIISAQSPSDIEKVHIILKNQQIPMIKLSFNPSDFIDFLNGSISTEKLLEKSMITTDVSVRKNEGFVSRFSYQVKPFEVETYLNDPSGFFKTRIGPTVLLTTLLGPGFSGESYIRFPFFSNVETNLPPITNQPIRSDIVDYLEHTGIVVDDLFANKFFRLGENSFGRISAGYLELQFGGVSGEYLKLFNDGRFGLGAEITWAKKRTANSMYFEEFSAITPFLNTYTYNPELNTVFHTSTGRFLSGDWGTKFQITRHIRGGSVFLWYTRTDTDEFTGPNKNYNDKGIGFVLPVRIFKGDDCQGYYGYAMSPWSRDVGQKVGQVYSLYDFIFEFTPAYISSHWSEITE